jgi:GAF domain-containing protein/HAMP domain-containing protein
MGILIRIERENAMIRRRVKLSTLGPLLNGGVLALAVAILTLVGSRTGIEQGDKIMLYDARTTLTIAARMLSNPLYALDVRTLHSTLNNFLGDTNIVHVAVRDASGQIVAEATDGWAPQESFSRELVDQAFAQRDVVHREQEGYIVLAGPVAVGAEQIGTLTTVVDPSRGISNINAYMRVALTSGAIVVVVVILITVFAQRLTAPLKTLATAADGIGSGNLDITVPIRGTEETATLGIAMERMRADLQALYSEMTQQTVAQERRANQLQVATEVAQAATAELDLSALLQRVVTLISERFDFYHTGLFLLDEAGEWAVLQATAGKDDQPTAKRGHRVRVGQNNVIGSVTRQGRPQRASDLEQGATYFDHPDLPTMPSQLALPLQARGEIIGALDVYSAQPGAFSDEDVNVLQVVANQIALAINNAKLFQQAQQSLAAVQRAYGELSQKAWAGMLQVRPQLGYYCDASGVTPLAERPDARQDGDLPEVSIPVMVRGQVIGSISAHKPGEAGGWTAEEFTLMQAMTEQLSVALENARLHQETQHRATRDRLIGQVTSQVRQSLDLETVLRTAVDQIQQALRLEKVAIRLATENQDVPRTTAQEQENR